jgi:transposase-like protein
MAQGKAFTPEQREEILQSLKPYLESGFSRQKACMFVGLPPQTLSNWVQQDEALGIKLTGWESALSKLALANVHKALQVEAELEDAKKENSWRYLERREDGFKPKQDITSDNEPITNVNINVVTQPTSEQDTGEELSEQN